MVDLPNSVTISMSGHHEELFLYSDLESRIRALFQSSGITAGDIQVGDCTLKATVYEGDISSLDARTRLILRGVGLKYTLRVSISISTPPEEFKVKPTVVSKVEILQALKNETISVGSKYSLTLASGVDVFVNIDSINDPVQSAESVYSALEIGELECEANKHFFVVTDARPKNAQAVKFNIKVEEGTDYDPSQEAEVNWIDTSVLRSHVLGSIISGTSTLTLAQRIHKLTLSVASISTADEVYKPLTSWNITSDTRVCFSVNPLLQRNLVYSSVTEPIDELVIFVKPVKSTVKNRSLTVNMCEIGKLLRARKIPWSLKQEFEIAIDATHSVGIRVDRLVYNDKEKGSADLTYLGRVSGKTVITYDSNDRYIQLEEQEVVTTVDYTKLESEIGRLVGLSGLSTEAYKVVRELVLPLGPKKDFASKLGLKPPKGVLLYGPPGTGKTTFAKRIADLLQIPQSRQLLISVPDLHKMYVGESEEGIRKLFQPAKESSKQWSLIFDEIDSFGTRNSNESNAYQDRIVTQLLSEMDGLCSAPNIIVFATTNNRGKLDPALLRDGRFGRQVHFDIPKAEQIPEILNQYLKPLRDGLLLDEGIDFSVYTKQLVGCSGSAIKAFVDKAKMACFLRDNASKVEKCDFDEAIIPVAKADDSSNGYLTMFS